MSKDASRSKKIASDAVPKTTSPSPPVKTATFTLGTTAARKVGRVQRWEERSAERKLILTGRN